MINILEKKRQLKNEINFSYLYELSKFYKIHTHPHTCTLRRVTESILIIFPNFRIEKH